MASPVYYTADMVRALPDDGNRYETVRGELLATPAPRATHQLVVVRLAVALELYLRQHRVGQVLTSPADISWDDDILVQPDVFVVELGEARQLLERIQDGAPGRRDPQSVDLPGRPLHQAPPVSGSRCAGLLDR